jgi:hypothetical protein
MIKVRLIPAIAIRWCFERSHRDVSATQRIAAREEYFQKSWIDNIRKLAKLA